MRGHHSNWLACLPCCVCLACGAAEPASSSSAVPVDMQPTAAAAIGVTPPTAATPASSPTLSMNAAQAAAGAAAGAPSVVNAEAAGTAGAAPVAGMGAVAMVAAGASAPATHDHCVEGEPADPRDTQLTDQPDSWMSPSTGDVDLVVPKVVLSWMAERIWEPSHDAWHNIRRCNGGGFGAPPGAAGTNICDHKDMIPEHQECADAEDGYEFLVMHRHMLQTLRLAFPQHKALFDGFPHFPFDASAVPTEWRARFGNGWSDTMRQTATTLEDIEHQLSMFPSEGDLGRFIQCGGMGNGASSIHGALHFKWVVNDSPYSLGKQTVNIDNHMFWKLHGWIDSIWERYRVAKGLAADEPKLLQALRDQCTEMHELGHVVKPDAATSSAGGKTLPMESGEFHEQVRPILEKYCASCHSESSPEAALSLGGMISSADIVKGLDNVQAMHGGQFKRVLPGDAQQSWLYLKAAGLAQNAGCTGVMCNAQVMPPTGQVTLSAAELSTLQHWIEQGAPAPP